MCVCSASYCIKSNSPDHSDSSKSFVFSFTAAAGIPDFRSPGSGLYDNIQKYELPHPQAIFEVNYLKVCSRC